MQLNHIVEVLDIFFKSFTIHQANLFLSEYKFICGDKLKAQGKKYFSHSFMVKYEEKQPITMPSIQMNMAHQHGLYVQPKDRESFATL